MNWRLSASVGLNVLKAVYGSEFTSVSDIFMDEIETVELLYNFWARAHVVFCTIKWQIYWLEGQ